MSVTLQIILREIRAREAALRECGVDRLYLFGSRVKGTATGRSDLDILVHFPPDHRGGYFDMARVKRTLEDGLGLSVDVQLEDSVPRCDALLEEAIRAF